MDMQSQSGVELPAGVTLRTHESGSQSIQIAFSFQGRQCRETLRGRKVTKTNIKLAGDLVARIRSEIAADEFDYLKRFPKSKRARVILGRGATITISELLDDYLESVKDTVQPSTLRSWKSVIKEHLKPGLGAKKVRELTPAGVIAWLKSANMDDYSLKFVRNCVTPLRSALYDAVGKGYISVNPASVDSVNVKKFVPKTHWKSDFKADPLSRAEVASLLEACAAPATRNLFQFAIATGLRTGELIALRWSDIDFDQRKCIVQRSIVEDYEKDTKTPKGNRAVDLSDEALEALINQRTISKKRSSVFCNPKTLLPLYNSGEIHWLWHKAVRKAEIKYRSPYQTRHTYASTKITDGCNLWELADQMGHVGTEMLNRHYGSWIEANAKATREQAHKDEKLEASAKEIEESVTVA